MTVAIAALAEQGKSCVLASDRQLSNLGLRFEIEHPLPKLEPFGSHQVAWAGDAAYVSEILRRARVRPRSGPLLEHAARDIREVHEELHLERAEWAILAPHNLRWETFRDRGETISNHKAINEMLFNYGVGLVEFLVAGRDETGVHVFRIAYDGIGGGNWIECCDRVGWRCIGTGGAIATLWLAVCSQNQCLSLAQTLFNVYAAKRVAETATGVGTATDIVITGPGGTRVLNDEQVRRLGVIWEQTKRGMVSEAAIDEIWAAEQAPR